MTIQSQAEESEMAFGVDFLTRQRAVALTYAVRPKGSRWYWEVSNGAEVVAHGEAHTMAAARAAAFCFGTSTTDRDFQKRPSPTLVE